MHKVGYGPTATGRPRSQSWPEAQKRGGGHSVVRTIGIVRAKAKIGLQNLAYNIRRLVSLERMAAA